MRPDLMHISWEKLQQLVENLAEKIEVDNFQPDIIIAISRGGFVPARILSDLLQIQRLTCIQIEYYKGINDTKSEPNLIFPLNADVLGLHVLIVDDVSDSGTSLIAALDHLKVMGAKSIKTSTVHIKPWTKFIPDYYSKEVNKWIVYPWEIVESLIEITQNMLNQGLSMENVKHELFKLGFDPIMVKWFNPQK